MYLHDFALEEPLSGSFAFSNSNCLATSGLALSLFMLFGIIGGHYNSGLRMLMYMCMIAHACVNLLANPTCIL